MEKATTIGTCFDDGKVDAKEWYWAAGEVDVNFDAEKSMACEWLGFKLICKL